MKISCTINDREVSALFDQLRARLGNLRPAMDEIGQSYERRVLENFEREQAPDGTPWRPTKVLSNYLGYVGAKKGAKRREAYTKAAFGDELDRFILEFVRVKLSGDSFHWTPPGRVNLPQLGVHFLQPTSNFR